MSQARGWLDISDRGRIRVTGEDRKRLVHAMTTNHVEGLAVGEWCYAFFLTAQGRIVADCVVICEEESLVIDVEPEVRRKVFEHLDKFIIADDAYLEDVTESTAEFAVVGDAVLPTAPTYVLHGVRYWIVPAAGREALAAQLQAVPQWTADEFRTWRLEHGIPRYGEDFSDTNLVQETQLMEGVHFTKGCYLGQEIVERVRSRGKVNKLLTPLAIEATAAPAPGTKILADGKEAGEITSAAYSSASAAVRALALMRAEFAIPSAVLTVEGVPAKVVSALRHGPVEKAG